MNLTNYWQQQAFAIDSKFNAYRANGNPHFKTLYIRRRNQLLRENTRKDDTGLRKQYLRIRTQLLQQRYNVLLDQASISSRSVSVRSGSRISDDIDNLETTSVVPTRHAEASRAIVGDNTISENYAFVGVHYIFDQHTGAVTLLKFANNDKSRLCCVSHDSTISICNVTSSPPHVEGILRGHTKPVTGCDWSASNDLMVSCSLDGTICLWEVASFKCIRRVHGPASFSLLSCLFHPVNNNIVVAGNENGLICVLNISTGKYPRGGNCKVGGQILSLTFDANGQLLWAGSDKGVITSLMCDDLGRLSKLNRIVVAQNCAITCLSWRAWISREARDPTLLVNCAANAVCLFRVSDNNGRLQLKKKFNVRHKSGRCLVRSTFCPIMSFREGACIVSGSEDSCVYFLDIARDTNFMVNKLQGHASPVLGVSFNYDESLLATSDQQGLVILWSREKNPLKEHLQNQ
ncbi:WD repeat-containing protein 13-like [Planococcus citri]|uniref:WD repeat-containing protein 13-like n=1 Tax=Planococcus citri TaxID=170843 RepID=UPI0031F815D5